MATSSSGPSRRVDPATLIRRARDLYSAARTEATLEDGDNNSANMKMSVALQSFKGVSLALLAIFVPLFCFADPNALRSVNQLPMASLCLASLTQSLIPWLAR